MTLAQAKLNYPRIYAELASTQWAITSEALAGILKCLADGLTSDDFELFHKLDAVEIQALTADMGDFVEGTRHTTIRGETGILSISGPVVPRASAFNDVSGIASTQNLSAEHAALENDPSIKNIVHFVDSPGGAVNGISDFARQIHNSKTPTSTFVFGQASSALYWTASATDKIIMSDTSLVGSIGTIATIKPPDPKDDGVIEIVSAQSPKKNQDPRSEAGQSDIQRIVNSTADVFISAVSEYMSVPKATVLKDFGQGGILTAKEALSVGMVHGISTFEGLLSSLENGTSLSSAGSQSYEIRSESNIETPADAGDNQGVEMKTLAELLAAHPHLVTEIEALKKESFDLGAQSGKAEIEALEARVKAATPYLASDEYPAQICETAAQVIAGTEPASTLSALVKFHDMNTEAKASDAAADDSEEIPETPGDGQDAKPTLKSEVARMRAIRYGEGN